MKFHKNYIRAVLMMAALSVISCSTTTKPPIVSPQADEKDFDYRAFVEPEYNSSPKTWYISTSEYGTVDVDLDGDGIKETTGVKVHENFRKINNTDNPYIGGGANVKPGDTILLKRGDTFTGPIILDSRGRSDQPIRIGAYGDSALSIPVLQIAETADATGPTGSAMILHNPAHFIIEDLKIQNAFTGIYLRYEDFHSGKSVTIRNCDMDSIKLSDSADFDDWKDMWKRGNEIAYPAAVSVGGRGWSEFPEPVLSGLNIHNINVTNSGTAVQVGYYWMDTVNYTYKIEDLHMDSVHSSDGTQGLMILNYVKGGTIENSSSVNTRSYNSSGITSAFIEYCRDLLITDNVFAGTTRVNFPDTLNHPGSTYTYDGAGFDFEGDCFNMVFTRNTLYNNDGAGLIICASKSGEPSTVEISNNLFYNNLRSPDIADRLSSNIGYLNSAYEIFIDFYGGNISNPNATGVIRDNKFYKIDDQFDSDNDTAADHDRGFFSDATIAGFTFSNNVEGIYVSDQAGAYTLMYP